MSAGVGGRGFRAGLVAVFLVGWALRALVVGQYGTGHPQADRPIIDEASYDRWAAAIADGDWLGDEVFFQEPLYAYALGLVYATGPEDGRRQRARHVQAFVGGATGPVIALLGAALFGPAAGLAGGALWALYRPALLFPALLLKPTLVLPCVALLALLLVASARRLQRSGGTSWSLPVAVLTGLVAGLGALLRGNLLILLPALCLWPTARQLLRREPLRAALAPTLALALGISCALAPVVLRNWVVGRELALTTSGAGTNFFGGNNAQNPYGIATEFDWVRGIPEYEADDWRREAERRVGRPLEPTDVSAYWLRQALQSMRTDPALHAAIFWRKLRLAFSSYEVPDNHSLPWDARFVPLLRAPFPGFGLGGWLGLAGALLFALARRREPPDSRPSAAGWDLALFGALYLGTIVLTVMSMRIRLALVPLLLPFAGYWLVYTASAVRGRSGPRLVYAGVTLAFTALLVHLPVLDRARRENDLLERDFNLAAQLVQAGEELDLAARALTELEARSPDHPRVVKLATELEFRAGRAVLERSDAAPAERRRAAERIERAWQRLEAVDRERANLHERYRIDVLAGSFLQYAGRFGEALERYEEALRFDPDDRELRRAHALCRAEVAVSESDPARRAAGLTRAAAALRELEHEFADPELARLRERVEAALRGGQDPE